MGLHNVELYNNLGLSCFYAGSYDMTLVCMERALEMATDESLGRYLMKEYVQFVLFENQCIVLLEL